MPRQEPSSTSRRHHPSIRDGFDRWHHRACDRRQVGAPFEITLAEREDLASVGLATSPRSETVRSLNELDSIAVWKRRGVSVNGSTDAGFRAAVVFGQSCRWRGEDLARRDRKHQDRGPGPQQSRARAMKGVLWPRALESSSRPLDTSRRGCRRAGGGRGSSPGRPVGRYETWRPLDHLPNIVTTAPATMTSAMKLSDQTVSPVQSMECPEVRPADGCALADAFDHPERARAHVRREELGGVGVDRAPGAEVEEADEEEGRDRPPAYPRARTLARLRRRARGRGSVSPCGRSAPRARSTPRSPGTVRARRVRGEGRR